MKRVAIAVFAASSLCVLAGEPMPLAPPDLGAGQLAVPAMPEDLSKWLDPDAQKELPDHPRPLVRLITVGPGVARSGVCYFIRTTRPVPAEETASRRGLIPLQARTSSFVKQPDCSEGAALIRLTPVKQEAAASDGGDSIFKR